MANSLEIESYRDLVAWQQSFELCLDVYRVTRSFPGYERYGLAAEMRKTARSVAANIAEGYRRSSTREYRQFLSIAMGSQGELETQLLLAVSLGYIPGNLANETMNLCDEVGRLLYSLRRALG